MPLILSVLFLVVYIISPADIFPSLAPLRIGLVLNLACALAIIWLFATRRTAQWPLQNTLILLFWVIIVLSRLVQARFGAALQALGLFMPSVIAYYILAHVICKKSHYYVISITLISICSLLSVISIAEYSTGDYESSWVYSQGFEELNDFGERDYILRARALGTLNDPNAFAQFLISTLPFWWVVYRSAGQFMKAIGLLLIFVVFYSCFITHSRGGLVGLVVFGFFALKQRFGALWSSLAGGFLFLVLLAAGFTGGRSVSLSGGENRIQIWSDGFGMFKSSPITGIGFGLFTEQSLWAAHNSFVECFSELGIFGYFVWFSMLVATVHQLSLIDEFSASGSIESWYGLAARATKWSLFSYLSMCMFLARAYSFPLYMIMGIGVAIYAAACSQRPEIAARFKQTRWVMHSAFASAASICLLYIVIRLS